MTEDYKSFKQMMKDIGEEFRFIGNEFKRTSEELEHLDNNFSYIANEIDLYFKSLEEKLENANQEALECSNCGQIGCPLVVFGDEDEPYCSIECLNEEYT